MLLIDIVETNFQSVSSHADMVLQSWKWTWTPLLLLIDTAKTNCYAQHVLLCADFNETNGLAPTDSLYCRPLPAKKFYVKLGLKMMKYKFSSRYWFEDGEAERRTAAAANPAGKAPSRAPPHAMPRDLPIPDMTAVLPRCAILLLCTAVSRQPPLPPRHAKKAAASSALWCTSLHKSPATASLMRSSTRNR